METINLSVDEGLPPVAWKAIVGKLADGSPPSPEAHNARTTWLTTINDDGSPHVTAVGALWLDETFWFQTGRTTRKHRNIERDPRCSVAVSILGADVVVEGIASRVTDTAQLRRATDGWAAGGWPAEVDPTGVGITAAFNAPSQGAPPWHVYRITPRSATAALDEEPGGLTRFRF
ncbi:MAG: pyridoxamine 5'-phosphate oxidase family protein [Microthrixaceae bacterium]|nr:pyridoxamine 5'-phosphate oxidase family protein [Microthrixaceae bacterium]MCO5313381.1 pyridoxamine 5'-phosphate oxidase family protein [Microthrixaceae bacterium]